MPKIPRLLSNQSSSSGQATSPMDLDRLKPGGPGGAVRTMGCIGVGAFALLLVAVVFGTRAFTTVETGHIGIVTEWGAATNKLLQPGLAFINPISEGVVQFDVRTQREDAVANVFSRDLQEVNAKLAINYRLDPEHVQDVFKTIGREYSTIVIDAKVQEAFKAVTAKYTAEELIAKRDLVKQDAEKLLTDRLSPYNIIVQDLNIVDFQWASQDFKNAIEQKQVAAQNVLKAQQEKAKQDVVNEQTLSIAETDKKKAILEAEAKAETQRLLQQTLTPELLQLQIIQKWNGVYPLYVGTSGNMLLQLPAPGATPTSGGTTTP